MFRLVDCFQSVSHKMYLQKEMILFCFAYYLKSVPHKNVTAKLFYIYFFFILRWHKTQNVIAEKILFFFF